MQVRVRIVACMRGDGGGARILLSGAMLVEADRVPVREWISARAGFRSRY
jgi:hypothetical protein